MLSKFPVLLFLSVLLQNAHGQGTCIFVLLCLTSTCTVWIQKNPCYAMPWYGYGVATARYYASHTKTVLATRKSVPRSSRQSDYMKTFYHRKETQTAVAWSCLPFVRSVQNHLARRSERGKKTRHTEEEVGWQRQGMDRPGVQVPAENRKKMEETGCEIICGAPTTLAVKE